MIAALLGRESVEIALLAARYTARIAFPLFLVTYSASSLMRLWPNETTRGLVRYRRQWGLGFALAHSIHLVALSSYTVLAHRMSALQTLAGGGLAYGLMYVMAFTSNSASMHALDVWWKRIHAAGIHWLWFIFTFTYFGRLFDPERWMQGALFFPLCLAALGLRLTVILRRLQPLPG